MFDHVKFGVSDYEKSKTFFLEALRPLGVNIIDEGAPDYGVEMSSGDITILRQKLLCRVCHCARWS